jgi:transcriptional regulator with XRE-family HTH domain
MRQWREARGIDQNAVARRIGVTKGAVSQWESSGQESMPTLRNLFAYCDAIGVPLPMLLACEPLSMEKRCNAI